MGLENLVDEDKRDRMTGSLSQPTRGPKPEAVGLGQPPRYSTENKNMGGYYEFLTAAELSKRGYMVSLPPNEATYDLLVTTRAVVHKVEVKSTTQEKQNNRGKSYRVRVNRNNNLGDENKGLKEFDYLIVHTVPDKGWYIIPREAVDATYTITVAENNRYGKYKDNW